jgi:hypothetical protein
MRESGCAELVKNVLDDSIPMYGRMVHGRDSNGELFEQSQQYDIYKRVRYLPGSCALRHQPTTGNVMPTLPVTATDALDRQSAPSIAQG